jgi:hypothetical protein
MENKYEVRYITELRADTAAGIVRGTAIKFNSESLDLGGFKEIIEAKPEEVRQLLDQCDIFMLYNHSADSGVLARSKNGNGTLQYTVDETGVHFEFKAKKKDLGIVESIEAGDLDGCSFAFRLSSDKSAQKFEKRSDGTYLRRIYKFDAIRDFSIVTSPAYPETDLSVRSYIDQLEAEEVRVQKLAESEAENKDSKFSEYYKRMLKKYLS